jgi:hypothetical protein
VSDNAFLSGLEHARGLNMAFEAGISLKTRRKYFDKPGERPGRFLQFSRYQSKFRLTPYLSRCYQKLRIKESSVRTVHFMVSACTHVVSTGALSLIPPSKLFCDFAQQDFASYSGASRTYSST